MGRTLVIGDIHGNYQALLQCLELAQFKYETDRLIVLGDVVDGHQQTYEVVEELLKVKDLILILGNHDAWFLDFISGGYTPDIWIYQGGFNTIASYSDRLLPNLCEGNIVGDCEIDLSDVIIPVTHQEFFNKAVPFYELGNKLFVHGGFDDSKAIKEQRIKDIIWDRSIITRAKERPIKQYKEVFIGHSDTRFIDSINKPITPLRFNNLWCLDTGCGWQGGKLTIMNINTKEYWQSDKVGKH